MKGSGKLILGELLFGTTIFGSENIFNLYR